MTSYARGAGMIWYRCQVPPRPATRPERKPVNGLTLLPGLRPGAE